MDDVPIEVLASTARRLGESVDINTSAHTAAAGAPNAALVCNILSSILFAQRRRNPTARSLQHQLRYSNGEDRMTLDVLNMSSLDCFDIEALRSISPRVLGIRFQFTSLQNDDPLGYGLIVVDLMHTCSKRTPVVPLYIEPMRRRTRAVPIDWSNSIVLVADREIVLNVTDDVYNVHQLMPVNMSVSIEPLDDADYSLMPGAMKRKKLDDAPTSTEESVSPAALIGYCIHFVGMPSFNENFLKHMSAKYATRWLGGSVLFPYTRKHGAILVPPQLVVSLKCEHALVQASKPRAVCGAKRLCKKIYATEE